MWVVCGIGFSLCRFLPDMLHRLQPLPLATRENATLEGGVTQAATSKGKRKRQGLSVPAESARLLRNVGSALGGGCLETFAAEDAKTE